MLRKLLRLLATPVLVLATLLHLSVKDAWQPLAVLFYALPLPLLALGWGMLWLLWGWRRTMGLVSLALALGSFVFWLAISHRSPSPRNVEPALTVLSWNMAHRRLPSASLEALLRTHRPDITGLVEVGLRHGDPNPLTASPLPGFTTTKLLNGMAVVVLGQVRVLEERQLPCNTKFAVIEATVDGKAWRIFIVDGVSKPLRSRREALAALLQKAQGGSHTVLLGDFNTPADSAHFREWRQVLHHAFDEAGSGLRETWPRWVPVLALDHVWSSGDALPLRAEKIWDASSDHAALLVELARK